MRRVLRSKRYIKSLRALSSRDRDEVEAAVDLLEGDWRGLDFVPIQGMKSWWRLSIGQYRVFCRMTATEEPIRSGNRTLAIQIQEIIADDVVRRSTTTYRKRN